MSTRRVAPNRAAIASSTSTATREGQGWRCGASILLFCRLRDGRPCSKACLDQLIQRWSEGAGRCRPAPSAEGRARGEAPAQGRRRRAPGCQASGGSGSQAGADRPLRRPAAGSRGGARLGEAPQPQRVEPARGRCRARRERLFRAVWEDVCAVEHQGDAAEITTRYRLIYGQVRLPFGSPERTPLRRKCRLGLGGNRVVGRLPAAGRGHPSVMVGQGSGRTRPGYPPRAL